VRVHAASCTLLHLSALVAARTVMHVRASVCEHWLKPPSHQRAGNTGGASKLGAAGGVPIGGGGGGGLHTFCSVIHIPAFFAFRDWEREKIVRFLRSLRSGCDEVGRDEVRLEVQEREKKA
jgi:hypothetical protein